jgi:RHS repeat-associated protein
MRAEGPGNKRSRFRSCLEHALLLLLGVGFLLTAAPAADAQTTYNVSGSWTGSVTEQPAGGPFPGGISANNYMLYQNGTTVIGSGLSILDGYWVNVAYAGSVSGSTLTLTSTVVSSHLPFGYSPCPGTTTFTINSTSTQLSAPASTCGGNVVNAFTMTGGGWNKQLGGSSCPGCAGSVDLGSGNVNEAFKDYETAGPNKLSFIRNYNSNPSSSFMPAASYRMMGFDHWITNFDRTLNVVSPSQIVAQRPDGKGIIFNLVGGIWTPDTDVDMALTSTSSTYTLTTHDDTVETYNQFPLVIGQLTNGLLASIKTRNGYTQTVNRNGSQQITSVTDSYSRSLTFTYNASGQLSTVTTPDSLVLTYTYSSSGINPGVNDRLATVSYNTSPVTSKSFNYGNSSFPFALTSITDENTNASESWTYDSYGRSLTDQNAGGAYLVTITYNDSAGTRTVPNAIGQPRVFTLVNFQNVGKIRTLTVTGTSTVPAASSSYAYDNNGYTVNVTDLDGHITTFTPDAHGDPTTIVEASGQPIARTTTVTYDATWVHLPMTIVTPGLTASYTYDGNGNVLTKVLTDTTTQTVPYSTNGQTRTWNYTWSNFLPHTIQSPNGNTTTFTYDATGALTNTSNALSQSIQVTSHTGGGLPLTIVDPNSVTATLTYSTRNWLLTKTLATSAGNLLTQYVYDAAGNLMSVTQPDGSALTNSYDIANRLTKVVDSFGNSLNYTLDALGNATTTKIENPSGTATKTTTATFDTLGRKYKDVNGSNWTTTYNFDNNGNYNQYAPPEGGANYTIDALDRRTGEAAYPYGSNLFTYDAHDRPLTVTSRNGSVTSFVYDGFGDRIQETSPDRGTTVYHFDSDGNLTSKTDALSIVANYTWDALDRPLTTSYPADTAENVAYTYDQTGTGFAFGIGRLTSLTDMAGSLSRTYDERGNVITEKRTNGTTTLTTSYGYDAVSRLATLTYPSGALVTYIRDAMGRITSVTGKPSGASSATTLASSITYEPFGPYLAFTYGNGINETVTRDGNYDLLTLKDIGTATVQSIAYAYAQQDQPTSYTDNLVPSNYLTMSYDGLGRSNTIDSPTFSQSYDNNGNRLSYTNGAKTFTYTANTNRLATIKIGSVTTTVTTDGRGSITAFSPAFGTQGVTSLSYNNAGRLASVSGSSGVLGSYVYDARGYRFSKTVGSTTTLFQHSTAGTLLEESTGGTATDYIYLNDRPIAMLTGSTFTYLHGNNLGTPYAATSSTQAVVWKGNYWPWGEVYGSTGSFVVNLRFPGQYYDAETGFNHNVHRDYIPTLGRYIESDPIGLAGGLNTYLYVAARPMNLTDPLGLYYWNGSSCYDTAGKIVDNRLCSSKVVYGFAHDFLFGGNTSIPWYDAFLFGDGNTSAWYNDPWAVLAAPFAIVGAFYAIDLVAGVAIRDLVFGEAATAIEAVDAVEAADVGVAEAEAEATTIDPNLVRFTQNSVSNALRTGESINELAASLAGSGGEALAAGFTPIRIFLQGGKLFTLDNRRLLAFSIAQRNIPYIWATLAEISNEAWKFTSIPQQLQGWYISVGR